MTTLAELPAAVLEHGIGSPAIVIIGDVVGVAASVSSTSQILEEQI